MAKKSTLNNFIAKAIKKHGDIYDYSLVEYINMRTKIKIICPKHKIFEQLPSNHLKNKIPCKKCSSEKNSNLNSFIDRANIIHSNKYDYSLVKYKMNKLKIKIICPEHGIFEQTPNSHVCGHGCPKCTGKFHHDTQSFIKISSLVHNNKYDYSITEYIHSEKTINIICPIHGIFKQRPHNHIQGQGCPKCIESKGEKKIAKLLEIKNIEFKRQKTFEDCRSKRKLPFDFYLPKYNILIEYDGIQHFKPRDLWGKEEGLRYIQKNDTIKNKYCIDNKIELIRIKYTDNIENIIYNIGIKNGL